MKNYEITPLKIDFTRINLDVNGNPRYVCHYLNFKPLQSKDEPYKSFEYSEALMAAKKLGGKKFHNKQYGGGIVFQSYNIEGLTSKILQLTGEAVLYSRDSKGYEKNHGNNKRKLKAFMLQDVTNKQGNLKKWFYVTEYNGSKTRYSLYKTNNVI